MDINEIAFQAMLREMRAAGLVDGNEMLARLVVLDGLRSGKRPPGELGAMIWQRYQPYLAAQSVGDFLSCLNHAGQEQGAE